MLQPKCAQFEENLDRDSTTLQHELRLGRALTNLIRRRNEFIVQSDRASLVSRAFANSRLFVNISVMSLEHRSEIQLALITGATRGLGRAITERFVEAGWTVIGCGRSPERVTELTDSHGGPHRFDVVDVVDDEAVSDWAASVLESHGAPDLLINNAALMNEPRPLWEVSPGEFTALIDVNLRGVFHVIRGFLPEMCRRSAGVVVNVSSGWGRSTSPEVAPYCATKWGVEGLTLALAQELPSGLAAVAFNPGIIDTDMLRTCFGESAGQYPDADAWSRAAVPFLMQLGPEDNGRSLTAPGA